MGFVGPCLFPFPPLSNCNKEWKCFRENKQIEQGQEEREKEKERERKRKSTESRGGCGRYRQRDG